MKNLIIPLIFIAQLSFAQNEWILDTVSSYQDEYMRMDFYRNYQKDQFKIVEYDEGVIASIEIETRDRYRIDSNLYYHNNGVLSGLYFFENKETYSFQLFDTLGRKYYQGQCFEGIRVGKWIEYDTEGNEVSWVSYKHKNKDPQLTLDSIQALKIEQYALRDTFLFSTTFGYDYPRLGDGFRMFKDSWGIVEGRKMRDSMNVETPLMFYTDGLTAWYPTNPAQSAMVFRYDLVEESDWDMTIYMRDNWHLDLDIPMVLVELFNYGVEKGDFVVNIWWEMYRKKDEDKVKAYYDSLTYKPYSLGNKIDMEKGVFFMHTKSFFTVFSFDLDNGKFRKAAAEFLPIFVSMLEERADQF